MNDNNLTLTNEQKLTVENASLKNYIAKLNLQQVENNLKSIVEKIFADAGVSTDTHGLDIDKGLIVPKQQPTPMRSKSASQTLSE